MNPLFAFELLAALIGGAIIGSFLSVLAARIPDMLLADGPAPSPVKLLAGISWPGSHCSSCDAKLGWRDNIPVLSYALLRGRCRCCGAAYGRQYLLLEISCAMAAALCFWLFGVTAEAGLCFALMAGLIALTAIDLRTQLLPDILLLPLLPLGLVFQSTYRDGLWSALAGMALGYSVMWGIGAAYRLATGRDGMGFGDVKMAAVLGAWLGVGAMPFFLVGAFASGVIVTLPLLLVGRLQARIAVPFGPFLCLSALVLILMPASQSWLSAALMSG